VPVIKGVGLSKDEKDFNRCMSHVRVCSEHTIGIWKGRWSILKRLPIQIRANSQEEDYKRAIDIMEACAVLHNFLLEEGDNWADGDHHTEEATPLTLGLSFSGTQQAFNAGADFRNGLMAPVLAAGRSPYGILTYEQHDSSSERNRRNRSDCSSSKGRINSLLVLYLRLTMT
jgi:hypothetical protein